MCCVCVCLFASSFLSLSSLSSLPLNLEQSPPINYNVKVNKKSVCVFVRVCACELLYNGNVETIKATINSLSKLYFVYIMYS